MIATAAMITMSVISMVMTMVGKGKSKKGVNDNPEVGYRYWGDAMSALATYSHRTAAVWASRVFREGEEYSAHYHLPLASFYGDDYNIGSQPVDTLAATAFNVPFNMSYTNWDNIDFLGRLNKRVKYTRAAGDNPQFQNHNIGAAMVHVNQGYLGLNTATLANYVVIFNSIPGTIFYLMQEGGDYNDMNLWVRWRETTDLSWTISINPVAIVADILLDQKQKDDIDWGSFAYAGKKLITESRYMWFSMAIGSRTHKEAVQDVLNKARLALRKLPNGKIGMKLVGEVPENGPAAFTIINALQELEDFSIVKQSPDESEVYNEVKGNYNAARYTLQYDLTDPSSEQFEGHMLEADMHAVNTGNIVLTGVRKQTTQDISFLSWPDDAKMYLEEVLSRHDRAFMSGTVTGGMWLSEVFVGDSVRLKVSGQIEGVVMDRVFEVEGKTIHEYPDEKVTLELKESHAWYDTLGQCANPSVDWNPNNTTTDVGWDSGQTPVPVIPRVFPIPMYIFLGSANIKGAPIMMTSVTQASNTIDAMFVYLVSNCNPNTPALEEDELTLDTGDLAINCTLVDPVTINSDYPGLNYIREITAKVMVPAQSSAKYMESTVRERCNSYAGVLPLLFSREQESTNYVIFSQATESNPAGLSILTRVMSLTPYWSGDDLYVRIQGVYCVDGPATLTFNAGNIVSILPLQNQVSSYGDHAAPLPAYVGLNQQMASTSASMRTVIQSGTDRTEWGTSYCDEYTANTFWMTSPEPVIYAASVTNVPSVDGIRVSSTSEAITFWINAADLDNIIESAEFFNIPRTYGAEYTIATDTGSIPVIEVVEARQSGIQYMTVTLRVKKGSSTVYQQNVVANTPRPTIRLNDLNTSVSSGDKFSTEFVVTYVTNSRVMDEPFTFFPITIAGPMIYYG